MLSGSEEAKEWAEEYSALIQKIYEKWQKPLGIDSEYQKFLKEDMVEDYYDPLKKGLFESIF